MKYTNNPEFIKFFQGFLNKNSLYTILTFQKGKQSGKKEYSNCSVAIAYNHRFCKVERFLINYDHSYIVKPSDNIVNRFCHIPVDKTELSIQNFMSDGKFSKNFLTYFIFYLILTKFRREEPNYKIKDIRSIDYLYKNDRLHLDELEEVDHNFIEDYNPEDKIIINIPIKYYNLVYSNTISNYYDNKVELKPYSNHELPLALQYVRRELSGRRFVDNVQLEQQIEVVNAHLLNKGKMFIQKEIDKEENEIWDYSSKTRKR